MQPAQPRPKLQYKQPGRLNGVSLTIAIVFGLVGYIGYEFWPIFSLRSNVESELGDALPNLWKLNHHSDSAVRAQIQKLKRTVTERVRQAGVKDKQLEVIFERNKKIVAMEARFQTPFTIPIINKTVTLHFRPRVETDAARVEW
jgi:hypothetical protein